MALKSILIVVNILVLEKRFSKIILEKQNIIKKAI